MEDLARAKLKQVMDRHGRDLFRNPRIGEVVRENLGPELKLEAAVLNTAVQFGLPQRLCAVEPDIITSVGLQKMANAMSAATGLKEDLTSWAARTWAEALGFDLPNVVPTVLREEQIVSTQPRNDQAPYVPRATSSSLRKKTIVATVAVVLFVCAGAFVVTQIPQRAPNLNTGCYEYSTRYGFNDKTVALVKSTAIEPNLLDSARQHIFDKGGTISFEQAFPPNTKDFRSFLRKVDEVRPGLIVVCAPGHDLEEAFIQAAYQDHLYWPR
jgi:hypothetical protein